MKFQRIILDSQKMDGLPCIRNLCIPVATVVDMIATGMLDEEILEAYPDLESEHLRKALQYAEDSNRSKN